MSQISKDFRNTNITNLRGYEFKNKKMIAIFSLKKTYMKRILLAYCHVVNLLLTGLGLLLGWYKLRYPQF